MKQLIFIMLAVFAGNVAAEPMLNTGYGFCLQEKDLDSFMSASAKSDLRMFDHLVDSGKCGVVGEAFPYSIHESGWFTAHVRVWVGENYVDIWVPVEALGK